MTDAEKLRSELKDMTMDGHDFTGKPIPLSEEQAKAMARLTSPSKPEQVYHEVAEKAKTFECTQDHFNVLIKTLVNIQTAVEKQVIAEQRINTVMSKVQTQSDRMDMLESMVEDRMKTQVLQQADRGGSTFTWSKNYMSGDEGKESYLQPDTKPLPQMNGLLDDMPRELRDLLVIETTGNKKIVKPKKKLGDNFKAVAEELKKRGLTYVRWDYAKKTGSYWE